MSSAQVTHKAPPPQEVDIDALFDEFDKDDDDDVQFKPLSAPLDEAALIREAEARARKNIPSFTPHQVLPSSSPSRDVEDPTEDRKFGGQNKKKDKEEKKAKRRLIKLDENRLLGPNGFPQLIKMTKDFRIKGKGHEATDLARLLQTYQYWTHQLYPKTPFRDTVERVEKLCHSKRMNVSLSVWRDEAHGRPTKQIDDRDEGEGADVEQMSPEQMNTEDRSSGPRYSPSHDQPRASSSHPESESDLSPQPSNQIRPASEPSDSREEDDEESFWRSMDEFSGNSSDPLPVPTTAANSSVDENEEMWNIIDEVEKVAAKNPSAPTTTTVTHPPQIQQEEPPDDWDDMYL
ncbi:replication fork protection component Swi3-domain-containing protein [Gymnopilus junonius]|uniref:Chromosome segregation in meiosis protein n=1 Tax=Gymnopilus junonius TaxID=109634 RepID=A0A9P5NWF6_GYMJU|nr:replication fork protection component Swi3-domain-containing protein [Gymnopilus junonius]